MLKWKSAKEAVEKSGSLSGGLQREELSSKLLSKIRLDKRVLHVCKRNNANATSGSVSWGDKGIARFLHARISHR